MQAAEETFEENCRRMEHRAQIENDLLQHRRDFAMQQTEPVSRPATTRTFCLYTVLGCTKSSTLQEINRCYNRKMYVLDPIRNINQSAADVHTLLIVQLAGCTLRNQATQAYYDTYGDTQLYPELQQQPPPTLHAYHV